MKFSDGYWLNKKHYNIKCVEQGYSCEVTPDGFRIIATSSRIYNRGQTLGGPNLIIDFFSPRRDIIGVRITHFGGTVYNYAPSFEIDYDDRFSPEVIIEDNFATLVSGDTEVQVELKRGWNVKFFHKGRFLTGTAAKSTALIREDLRHAELMESVRDDDYAWNPPMGGKSYIRERLSLGIGEKIYGFGEKFTQFVKNGQTVDIWNSDGGTCSDLSYKSVPFYVSSTGYGVFVNHSGFVSFEVATEVVNAVSFSASGENMEYFVIGGENPAEAVSNYTLLTGRPALPPPYTFGLWLTTSFTTKYDEETVTSFIDGMSERKIPLSVFHFDCFWMREYHWCDFKWDTRQFPEPDAMLTRLKERGLKICVWINPYISQHSDLFDDGVEFGYFIKNQNGEVYQSDDWQPGMAIVDFTNPEARTWFKDKIKGLIESGIDCVKTDFGERIPLKCKYYDGSDPEKMHNYYSYLYNKTVFSAIEEVSGKGSACLFARSGTAGSQKFPVHWGGDCSAEYSSMAETIRGGLSLCASGFGFFSHDISGFESTATPDIYKRWLAFGLLSTHSRLHGNSSYRVPWLFDEEACDVLRHFVNLKGKLMPYLYCQAAKTSRSGVPMMRPMVMDFSSDIICRDIETQYMLGEKLLVAPILNDRGECEFYVPDCGGEWTDIQSGERYEGGKYYFGKYDYYSLPLLVKPRSIIAFGDFKGDFEYDYLDGTEFVIYGLGEGESASCEICTSSGKVIFSLEAERTADTIYVSHTPKRVNQNFSVTSADSCEIEYTIGQ